MKKENEIKTEIETGGSVSANESVGSVDQTFLDLLKIDKDEAEVEEFIKHTITAKVSGFRLIVNPNTSVEDAVQIQCKSTDAESGALIDFTFKLNNDKKITEQMMKEYRGKTIQVSDINRYTTVERDHRNGGAEIKRTHNYGGAFTDIKIVNPVDGDYEINSYVEVELTAVENIMKKDKPTGEVRLNSVKEDGTGSKTFSCVLKKDELKMEFKRSMFEPLLGRKIRINNLREARISGKTYYSTLKAITLAK